VNILDENIIKSQRQLLKSWRIPIRQIGYEVGRKGMKRDLGFYEGSLCHKRYCLVCMAVDKHEAAVFMRRWLRHGHFDTQAKRMGAVIRLSRKGVSVWRLHAETEAFLHWTE